MGSEKLERHTGREDKAQRLGADKLRAVRVAIPDVAIQPVVEAEVLLFNNPAEAGRDHQLVGQVEIDVAEQRIGIGLEVRIRGRLQVKIALVKAGLTGNDVKRRAADARHKKRDAVIGVEHRTEEITTEDVQPADGVREALGGLCIDVQVIGAGDPAHAIGLAFQADFLGEPVHIGLAEIDELRHRGIANVQRLPVFDVGKRADRYQPGKVHVPGQLA